MTYLLALDQGTSSSRSIIFNHQGQIIAAAQQEFRQIFPQPGWVEHDPAEIWLSQFATARQALRNAGLQAQDIAAIGITNQRETTLLWDKQTGQVLSNAIVWQDRRTASVCESLRADGHAGTIREKTGLILDPYFSASKLQWLLQHLPGAMQRAKRGELAFGTVDTWLAWQLSEGKLHVTDSSNASRTMLFNIHTGQWDPALLELFGIPAAILPEVHPSSHHFGETHLFGSPIPIAGIAGDQQAALFGQACFTPGMAKNTYGTGCFMLMHTGQQAVTSHNGLISTVACQTGDQAQYALEGSVFIGGAVVQWLRDGLKAIQHSPDVEALAASVPDSGGVVFVPAFTGLGAPYWVPDAKAAIVGLSRGSTVAHIARAALESIAFQTTAVLQAMIKDAVCPITELRVDGGAAANNLLLQFQANLLGIPVVRPQVTETTALGAACLAGLGAGIFSHIDECALLWQTERQFLPTMSRDQAQEFMQHWETAVGRVR
ncbi:glycerol kinase GlpK [Undibacterium oligocarboniphilum]|uniref:Glycerol kinase n=1 Tax=Undibacterium oligocarboniphilum TaxID=666702 RepID=A0A850QMY0_9BURK|nr:glycerol kinase GlpK [Undibacterium oligocarboniphilum]MBC3869365.1 glycerol kinase GlpK [Undibacterium oligocarboniphilum]NVO77744.1 glycerol kinase GlpK [Undibacterium oligocarboniphilum]